MPAPWEKYAAPAAGADSPGPWLKYSAPPDPVSAGKANYNTQPDAPVEQQGLFRSFYDTGVKPFVDMVTDTIKRGDLGEHAANEILDSLSEQAKVFAAHPDIRNLPIIGTGATATAARMQKQVDAGNYAGAIGTAAGFVGQFAAPEAAIRTGEAIKAAPTALKQAAAKVRTMLPDSIPEIPAAGTAADVAGVISPRTAHVIRLVNRGVKTTNKVLGAVKPEAAPELSPLDQHFARMRDVIAEQERIDNAYNSLPDVAEPAAAEAAAPARPKPAPSPLPKRPGAFNTGAGADTTPPGPWQKYAAPRYQATEADFPALPNWQPGPAGTPAPAEPAWEPYRDPNAGPQWQPGPPGTPTPAEPAWSPYRAAEPATAPEAAKTRAPELTEAQRVEDAADELAARMQHEAEDMIWANRARKADRFAAYLAKNNLDAKPENLAAATKALSERAVPSDETVPMIEDRLDFLRQQSKPPVQSGVATDGRTEASAAQAQSTADVARGTGGTRAPVSRPGRASQGLEGKETRILLGGENGSYGARYRVQELDSLRPSHSGQSFQPNEKYAYQNDRNYDDPVNQYKIVNGSTPGTFAPELHITDNPDLTNGPVAIDSEGNVLGGNGRSMILDRVYAHSNPVMRDAYRQMLIEKAQQFGIDPAAVAKLKQPVLVRVVDDAELLKPGAAQKAITDFNKVGTAPLTPAEQAIADGSRVSQDTLDAVARRMEQLGPETTLARAIDGPAGIDVLNRLIDDGVITRNEQAKLSTGKALTEAGKDRVSALMLGRYFGRPQDLENLAPSLRNKLERIAAPLARVEGEGYNLSPTIRQAIALIEDAKAHGITKDLEHYADKYQDLYGNAPQYSPAAVKFAKNLLNRDPNALTKAVNDYVGDAKYAKEYAGPGMFGEFPNPKTPADAFEEHFGERTVAAEAEAKIKAKAKKPASDLYEKSKAAFDEAKAQRGQAPPKGMANAYTQAASGIRYTWNADLKAYVSERGGQVKTQAIKENWVIYRPADGSPAPRQVLRTSRRAPRTPPR